MQFNIHQITVKLTQPKKKMQKGKLELIRKAKYVLGRVIILKAVIDTL